MLNQRNKYFPDSTFIVDTLEKKPSSILNQPVSIAVNGKSTATKYN